VRAAALRRASARDDGLIELLLRGRRLRLFGCERVECSHAEEKLECGRIRNGWISCPAHGARFSLETGEAMNHPATLPIQTFPIRIVDEWVEVQA
jgi:3-phenylpropionate/trans-cinnamate dioxygenase ferredoxin subunit